MIEMLSDLIAAILGLIKRGEFKKASERLERIYYDMLKQDASFFQAIPGDELTHTLLQAHNFTLGHLEILAELFNAEAELELAQGNRPGSLEYSQKSLTLFRFLDTEQKTYSQERIKKMEVILERIKSLQDKTDV